MYLGTKHISRSCRGTGCVHLYTTILIGLCESFQERHIYPFGWKPLTAVLQVSLLKTVPCSVQFLVHRIIGLTDQLPLCWDPDLILDYSQQSSYPARFSSSVSVRTSFLKLSARLFAPRSSGKFLMRSPGYKWREDSWLVGIKNPLNPILALAETSQGVRLNSPSFALFPS